MFNRSRSFDSFQCFNVEPINCAPIHTKSRQTERKTQKKNHKVKNIVLPFTLKLFSSPFHCPTPFIHTQALLSSLHFIRYMYALRFNGKNRTKKTTKEKYPFLNGVYVCICVLYKLRCAILYGGIIIIIILRLLINKYCCV